MESAEISVTSVGTDGIRLESELTSDTSTLILDRLSFR